MMIRLEPNSFLLYLFLWEMIRQAGKFYIVWNKCWYMAYELEIHDNNV